MTHPEYDSAIAVEDDMRKHMYQPDYQNHAMNTDPHYDLVRLDAVKWRELKWHEPDRSGLIFPLASVKKLSWRYISRALEVLRQYTAPGVVVAGGAVYAALTGTKAHDIDLFIHGTYDYDTAIEKAKNALSYSSGNRVVYVRTPNSVTVECKGDGVYRQVILRHYRSISEIIHGFDVDSCCFAFDGEHVWATPRALFALTHGYNTVNFDRLSPSYIPRLAKYAMRGMAVFQPGFDRSKVDSDKMIEDMEEISSVLERWQHINKTRGISRLLLLEAVYSNSEIMSEKALEKTLQQNLNANSDYGTVGIIGITTTNLRMILETFNLNRVRNDKFNRELWYQYVEQLQDDPEPWENILIPSYFIGTNRYIGSIDIEQVLRPMPDYLYAMLTMWRSTSVTQRPEFKTHQPGEQMTNTFNKEVLSDSSAWFNTGYYRN